MEFYSKKNTENRLVLIEEGIGYQALAALLFLSGAVWLFITGLEGDIARPLIITIGGFLYLITAATRRTVLCKDSGELRVEKRRVLPFTSTSQVLPLETAVVPKVTFKRGRLGLGRIPTLNLLMQNGERIKLHAYIANERRICDIHDEIWNYLDLSPGQNPPDPFA